MSASAPPLKLKLKLSTAAPVRAPGDAHASAHEPQQSAPQQQQQSPLLIGARGGAALKDLLSTAPNPEVAIRSFQDTHGLTWAPARAATDDSAVHTSRTAVRAPFTPAVQLLDLLAVSRSSVYTSVLETLKREMLLRIEELPQEELQRVLEVTFPYIEFRELRAIPIAILARQDETPAVYLRELTENRKILHELPVHVRRKIMHVEPQELHLFVEACTQEYVEQMAAWYLTHPGQAGVSASTSATASATASSARSHSESLASADASVDLWNVSSHMPSSASSSLSAASATGAASARHTRWGLAPEERRRTSAPLERLTEMLGDSESLYLATVEILKDYVVAANIPGSTSTASTAKEYVDYVPFIGALRADLANVQRDKTTALLRTDPLHKFIWFLDRALKQQTLEPSQLHELLGFISKLRTGDLPPNKKFKKKSSSSGAAAGAGAGDDDDEAFEVVLGPPPVDELLAVLDKLAKVDVRMIFAEPVPDDVPKYRDVIKEPMDLSTMRKRAKRGKYKSVELFIEDFDLMIRNCLAFNPDTTVFYKEAKRVSKRGHEIFAKHMTALRGEPQRIRAKKRRKVGASDAVSMLTSAGVASLRDFGDVDQSGMVPEGMCDDMLADAALVLSDPPVKQLLSDALLKHLVLCWQRRELPTDNVVCRSLVQLLQIGNPSSVRRMLRKRDFVLRAPQVVTMRVVLPLVLRTMATHRIGFAFPLALQRDVRAKEDVVDRALWESVLCASSAIRTLTKALIVQSLVDHHVELAAQLLQFVLAAEDDLLLRDRPLLHAITDVVLEQIKAALGATTSGSSGDQAGESQQPSASDRVKATSVWKLVVCGFFVTVLAQRIEAMRASDGSVVVLAAATDASLESEEMTGAAAAATTTTTAMARDAAATTVQTFPVPVFHEKTVMLLVAVVHLMDKADAASAATEDTVASLVQQTLGVVRRGCVSLSEFELLWSSAAFQTCRELYEQLLAKCPRARSELFQAAPVAAPAPAATATATAEGDAPAAAANADATKDDAMEATADAAPASAADEPAAHETQGAGGATETPESSEPPVVLAEPAPAADVAMDATSEMPRGGDAGDEEGEVEEGEERDGAPTAP